ncbi:hypothetical protein T069G_05068 [Trichoderma breve]|uniref:DUF7137 domain-containing protein n=1 Tax=Trichoderma breve TaxID=2034170 RepID=A0A9W9BBG3_9HYPO|nr:hypothetical protein T069G_05068 [Trichoderma breve]KAJ4860080.1 hypothetical protein T069G_05068 [Trichoderma breve]
MRPTATLMRLALCLSSAAPLVSAWPGWLPELDALVVRADKGSEGNTANPTSPTNPPNEEGNTAQPTQPSESGKKGGSSKTSDSGHKKTTTTKKAAHHTQFDPEAPPGNVVMQTPNVFAGSALYKIDDYVTWGWNYTNLLGTPTAVDVLISCSQASETWTLTSNMTFKTSVEFVWDSSANPTPADQPFPVAMYTLIIKDSDAAITSIPDPGYLGTFNTFTFGLYTPQPYVPFPEWHCDACNAALSKFDHHVLGFAITMGLVTVLSFTWFVSGLDIN